jgi:hypothetical protein
MYIVGLYTRIDQTIHIWMFDPTGSQRSPHDLRMTWLHEYVHYLDHCLNCDPPLGAHNELFEFRIKEMGWDRFIGL